MGLVDRAVEKAVRWCSERPALRYWVVGFEVLWAFCFAKKTVSSGCWLKVVVGPLFCNEVCCFRCHIGVYVTDATATAAAEMYSPAFENLVPYTALQLKEAEEKGHLLTAELEAALENKHVVCYIKYFNKLIRGAITKKYSLVKIYLYSDVFPNAEAHTEHEKQNPFMLENETVDLTKDSEDDVQFFTPSTKVLIEQISRSSQDDNVEDAGASACKRLLTFDDAQISKVTVKLEPKDNDDTVKSMQFASSSTESPGKRCKAKQS